MDREALHALKQALIKNTDPAVASVRFFEAIQADAGFMDRGTEVQSDLVEAAVVQIGSEIFGKVRLDDFALARSPDHHFLYGVLKMNRRTGTVLYFDDIGIGLVTIFLSRRETRLARFEARPLPVGHIPHQN